MQERTMNSGERILHAVAARFDFEPGDILKHSSRDVDSKHARSFVCYELKEILGWSYPRISRFLGYKNHTSVMYCVKRGAKMVDEDEGLERFSKSLKEAVEMHTRKKLESLSVLDF